MVHSGFRGKDRRVASVLVASADKHGGVRNTRREYGDAQDALILGASGERILIS